MKQKSAEEKLKFYGVKIELMTKDMEQLKKKVKLFIQYCSSKQWSHIKQFSHVHRYLIYHCILK